MAQKGEFKKGAKAASVAKRKFNSSEEQKTRRAQRNAARREMVKKHGKAALRGKDIDHKNHKARGKLNNSEGNLRIMDKSKNRAKNLGTGGRKRGS